MFWPFASKKPTLDDKMVELLLSFKLSDVILTSASNKRDYFKFIVPGKMITSEFTLAMIGNSVEYFFVTDVIETTKEQFSYSYNISDSRVSKKCYKLVTRFRNLYKYRSMDYWARKMGVEINE